MTAKRDTKRTDLRNRIISAAAKRIETAGLKNLRARDLAQDASCALGAIYTAFDDLDAVITAVNAQTVKMLIAQLKQALTEEAPTEKQIQSLVTTYLSFTCQHNYLWQALFNNPDDEQKPVPAWIKEDYDMLLATFAQPFRSLFVDKSEEEISICVRIFFAGIHGLIIVSTDRRFGAIASEKLEAELQCLTNLFLKQPSPHA